MESLASNFDKTLTINSDQNFKDLPVVIFVLGTTGVGKSKLALDLA